MNLFASTRFRKAACLNLAGISFLALASGSANAKQDEALGEGGPAPAQEQGDERDAANGVGSGQILVSANRLRGQLVVEQPPLLELDEADIAAEGVTSIADLITQISNQTGSARGRGGGGRPVVLINGIRAGSFREFANYPPEALARVEVFPEEVAQRFGFAPDRRVINLILKENYRNFVVELEFEGPARGGSSFNEQELGYLQIADGARVNLNFEAGDTSLLTEAERDIIQTPGSVSEVASDPDQADFRSLQDDSRVLEGNLSWAKAIIDSATSISANANYVRSDRRSLRGLNTVQLTDPGAVSALRTFGIDTPLEQRTASDTVSVSGSLNRPIHGFQFTSTFNASLSESEQEIDRRFDTAELEAEAIAGRLALDAPLPSSVEAGFDIARSRSTNATSFTTLRGPITNLPAGELLATFDLSYNWTNLRSSDTRGNLPVDLTRGDFSSGVNLVIPLTSRRTGFADALGSITLSSQIGLQHLSDFGTLGDYTLGLNWSPFDRLNLSATYIMREVAPDLTALGAPQVETFNAPVFDFTTGETVLATLITGGNPTLLAETQRDWKISANWQLPFWDGARLTVDYIRNRSDDVTSSFPQITSEIEGAFPDRITRDANGTLVSVDRRSVTFDETRADRLQVGLFLRGSIGAGDSARGQGGPSGQRGSQSRPSQPTENDRAGGGAVGLPSSSGGAPSAQQRAAFLQFRSRICADDGLEVLSRLVEAASNGEDLSAVVPGFDAQRFARLLERVRGDDGAVDPQRLARIRDQICSFEPSGMARSGVGAAVGQRNPPSGPRSARRQGFAALRDIVCGQDGVERLKSLLVRIEAGEDVSEEIPDFDPQIAQVMMDRLRDADGNISDERIAGLRNRFCRAQDAGTTSEGGQGEGGPPPGFNPLARRSFPGFRYSLSLRHTIELDNQITIAPGVAILDQLDGQATGAFGLPRHSSQLEAGLFGQGLGMRFSARYLGKTRLEGSGIAGTSDLFFDDLATFDIRLFGEVGQMLANNEGVLKNVRVSLRLDNLFDARRRVTDANGDTPLNYQPFLIDPIGRYIGIDLRKLF